MPGLNVKRNPAGEILRGGAGGISAPNEGQSKRPRGAPYDGRSTVLASGDPNPLTSRHGGRMKPVVVRDASPRGEARAASDHASAYVSRLVAERLAVSGPIEALEVTKVRAALLLTDVVDFTGH